MLKKESGMYTIMIVEDDRDVRESIEELLIYKGYKVVTSENAAGIEKIRHDVDMYLLDVFLPDGNGFDICKSIRKKSDVPIIFITSCDDEQSIVTGLDIGGDDYITKPFHNAELLSRISANLRRVKSVNNIYDNNGIRILFDSYKVYKEGKELNISTTEFNIIKILVENRGCVVKRDTLFEKVWDIHGNFVEYNTLTVAVSRIKAKLGTYGEDRQSYIETIRNVGYRWIV